MKIAIITQPLRTNYGGILQNYALHTILKRMGHKPTTLQRDDLKAPSFLRFIITLAKRFFKKLLGKYTNPLFVEKQWKKDYPIITKNTLGFVNRHIKMCVIDYDNPLLKENDFDAYVVGSDQVWRPSYNNINFTFLGFTKGWNVKRLAYAASFGTDEWEFTSSETEKCKSLASQFDCITVRESSGVELCRKYFCVEAEHVIDPTLLLKKMDYEKLIEDVDTKPSGGQIFVHVLDKDPDKYRLVDKIAQINNWKSFEVNCKVDEHEFNVPVNLRIQPPIEQWLRAFKEAEFIVTDSFHAMVFSIIFNKPFLVYANTSRGAARFISLLSLLGLENRLLFKSEEFNKELLRGINYNIINEKIDVLRNRAFSIIKEELDN